MKETFNFIIAWIDYLTEWITYGTKCTKSVTGSIAHLRDSWPSRPVIPKPIRKIQADTTVSDTANPVVAGSGSTDNKILDGSIGV
jgi:hypothetical protein